MVNLENGVPAVYEPRWYTRRTSTIIEKVSSVGVILSGGGLCGVMIWKDSISYEGKLAGSIFGFGGAILCILIERINAYCTAKFLPR